MPIRKRGKTWYTDLYVNGRRTRKKLSTNKATAQKIYEDLIKQKDLSPFGISDYNYDIKQFQRCLLLEVEPNISAKTLHDYEVLLSGVTEHLNNTPLQSVRNKFNEYLLERQKQGLSIRTLNLIIELTKRMFRHAVETNLVPLDPLSGTRKFKSAKKLRRALMPEEIKSLLESSGKYRIVWLTFLGTGLRRSELVELKWKDVDLKKGELSVTKERPGKGVGVIPM